MADLSTLPAVPVEDLPTDPADLLTKQERSALAQDLARMARSRRHVEVQARQWEMF